MQTIRIEAKYPNALIGMISEKPVARNAEAVVKLVTNIAFDARR